MPVITQLHVNPLLALGDRAIARRLTYNAGDRIALVRFQRRPTRIAFPGFGVPTTFPGIDEAEKRMNRFFERALGDPFDAFGALPEALGWLPPMEIVENDKELTLTAKLPPGWKRRTSTSRSKTASTVFRAAVHVDLGKVIAEFNKGVLKVHLLKDGVEKPNGRKVEIKTG